MPSASSRVVAEELRRAGALADAEPDGLGGRLAGAGPGLAGLGALALHRLVEGRGVDADAAGAQRVLRQVEREAERVVELEGGLAGERVALVHARRLLVEERQAAGERRAEARLLELERLGDERLRAHQLGIGRAHLVDQRRHQPVHQRLRDAEKLGMPHGAAHDAAQHVAAAVLRGQHAVGDQEGGGAQVVGDDAVARLVRALRRHARRVDGGGDQVPHRVGLVVVVRALQHRRDALEPHAGVDRGPRQLDAPAGLELLELHEDEVPDLDEPVAVLVRAAGRAAGDVGAVVVEDLRARAARAGIAHLPEIVARRDPDDLLVGQAGDLLPEVERLVVLVEDGDEQPVLRQAELLRHEVPGKLDRAVLEVVAEREVAEHLEEGVVPGGVADIVEVVVLAAGADAFLRRHGPVVGPLLLAGEDVLELHHAGVGEEQGRVVARHERPGRHDLVAVFGKVVQERGTDLVDAGHLNGRIRRGSGTAASSSAGPKS